MGIYVYDIQTGKSHIEEDSEELKKFYEEGKILTEKLYWTELRNTRNKLLADTDYLALSDTTEMSDAWKTYRQQLRDLPANTSDAKNPTYPTKPELQTCFHNNLNNGIYCLRFSDLTCILLHTP